jgi:hypothetical protein
MAAHRKLAADFGKTRDLGQRKRTDVVGRGSPFADRKGNDAEPFLDKREGLVLHSHRFEC